MHIETPKPRKPRGWGKKCSQKQIKGKKHKEKDITQLTKELDKWFSLFVRLTYANKWGMVTCYTCPHVAHYKKIHAGHYITRFFKLTRWDENNVRPQCFIDNIYRKGNAVIFRQNLVKEMGLEEVEKMEKSVDFLVRGGLPREFFAEKIPYYKAAVENLLDKLKSTV